MGQDYFVVDVFTGTALAGNPLAVVMNTAGPDRRARSFIYAKASRSTGQAIRTFLLTSLRRGSRMFASRAALLLGQKDGFSCRDAHAFNRFSSWQVTACLESNHFPPNALGF
jgi:hypothetical protein